MRRIYKCSGPSPGHRVFEIISQRQRFESGELPFSQSPLSAALPDLTSAISQTVASFLNGDFATASSLIASLTSWFSDSESQIQDSGISLIPLVSAYRNFEFDRMIWTSFATKIISVSKPLIPHLQQLSIFPDFLPLFSDHFYLNSLLAYISDGYCPIHLIQYSLFLSFLLPIQSTFSDAIPTFSEAFPSLASLLREASADRCLLELIHSAICAFPELANCPALLIANLEFPNDPPARHRLYRICIRLVRQSQTAAGLLMREDEL
jgi:hypothetical protein